jgi:hypothetical protein
VADRFVEEDLATAFDGEGTILVLDGTGPTAIGTGVFGGEGSGLLLQQDGEGSLSQAVGGGDRDLLHGGEVEGA